MSLEIYINDRQLYLKPSTVVALTKQINDIAEIQKRQADFTNRFTVPMTPENMMAMESLNIPGNTSTRPYKWGVARIINSGVTIVSSGIGIVTETKQQAEYELLIYAGNYDLFSRIDGKLITDLDWSDLVHVFNSDNWINSWTNTENYIYPIAETLDGKFKLVQTGDYIVDIRYQAPHVFVKTIWNRIFNEAGLKYAGTFFTTDYKYLNELVPADVDNVDKELNSVRLQTKGDKLNPGVFPFSVLVDEDPNNLKDTLLDRNYVVKEDGRYVLSIDYNYQVQASLGIVLFIAINGVTQLPGTVFSTAGCAQETLHIVFTKEYDLKAGDRIAYAAVSSPRSGCSPLSHQSYEVDHEVNFQYVGIPSLYGYDIDFSLYLPKVSQVNFLRAIMQQYGLLYQLRPDGVYEFITIEDLLNGAGGVKDYSSVYQGEKSETYRIGKYGIENKFKYNYYDKDLIGEGYADSSFFTQIDDLDKEATIIDSVIEACGDYKVLQVAGKISSIHSFEKQNDDKYLLRQNDKLKTVILNKSNGFELTFYDSNTHIYGQSYTSWTIPFVKFTELHWDNLLIQYYPKFIKMLQKPIKKKVGIWQTPIDIYFLDMFKLAYFEQYQSFFYINKLNNFVDGKVTEAEIIKIN